jgi:conjugal transfer ATP-binding protein TraC
MSTNFSPKNFGKSVAKTNNFGQQNYGANNSRNPNNFANKSASYQNPNFAKKGNFEFAKNTQNPTSFGQTSTAIYQTKSLGDELQKTNKTSGAYGSWGQKANPFDQLNPYNSSFSAISNSSQNPQNPSNFFQQKPPTKTLNPNQTNIPISGIAKNLATNLSLNPNQKLVPNYNKSVISRIPNQQISVQTNLNRRVSNPNYPNQVPINNFRPNQRPNSANFPPQIIPTRIPKKTIPKTNGLFGFGKRKIRKPINPRQIQQLQKKDTDQYAYLKKLSPVELRKQVIRTESEIQKTLIENEKNYRKGVSTIRDLISPSSVRITPGSLEIGTKQVRTFFVLTYPRVISSGWLEGIVNADLPIDISIFIYPQDSGKVLKELKNKVGKIQASLQLNQEKGAPRDPQLETAYRDVEGLRDAIQQGVEKFFRIGVYVTVYADDKEQMEKYSQAVEGFLNQQNIILKRSALQMDDGFNSTLPLLKDDLFVYNNMNTSPLSASFPFVSSELSSDVGILYGINRHNSSLIIFDRFELENANEVVFATSGAGKSYAVKLEILRSLMIGVNVIVIDPEQEYKILADTLGGTYINMSLNSNNRINPFDLPKALPGENNADILRTSIIDLMGLMNLMLGKLDPQEVAIMEQAIAQCYAKRDITPESDFSNIVSPTMGDLVEILNGIVGGESMAQRLYRYTEGTFAGIFNNRTNININNTFIVFNIRDLQEPLRPIAMYILLKYVWNEIRSELKRRILAIDEAWILMQYEDSARFLYGLVKRARKYYLGVTTITQDVGDFLKSDFGRPIVTNSALKILLKQSTASIDQIAETFALTSGEKQVLLQSDVGQGIFFAGPRHVAIEIIAFPTEHRVITTNPKDLLKMQEFVQDDLKNQ